MTFIPKFEKPVIFRILLAIVLGCTALTLFLTTRDREKHEERNGAKKELGAVLADLDRDVDTVLARFGIEKEWIKKKHVPLLNSPLYRIERRVAIPPDVVPVQMNVAFNIMAQRYDGRAVASENLKENTVTVHIEVDGNVYQTIVLKPVRDLKRKASKEGQANV